MSKSRKPHGLIDLAKPHPQTHPHTMKRILALMLVAVSVACLQAAPERTVSSRADGIEKVVQIATPQLNIQVADFNAALFTTPVAVLVDVRPQAASTKVFAFSAAPVHWKVAYRAPIVEIGLICAASPPTAPLGPDNPGALGFVADNKTPSAWLTPDTADPTIEVAQEGQNRQALT
jgi:hypothetical protein